MSRLVKPRRQKAGLPPGSIVFVGEQRSHPVTLSVTHYDGTGMEEHTVAGAADVMPYLARPGVTWLNVDGVHEVEQVRQIGELFGIHPLILEDVANTGQRPRVEEFEPHLYLVLKMLSFDERRQRVHIEQVSLIVGENYLISFLEDPGDIFDTVRTRLRTNHSHLRTAGPDYLAYALLDTIVDYYFVVLERLGELAETLEEEVADNPTPEVQHRINRLRRELIYVRRALWPARELFGDLEHTDTPLIQPETRQFLRDVHGHAIQVIEVVESLRDVLSSLTDVYMSSLSNRMNEVMKFLTVIGTIFIPLTFIAGVYGMNFEFMPELHWKHGYLFVWGLMLAVALGLIAYFKRRRWI